MFSSTVSSFAQRVTVLAAALALIAAPVQAQTRYWSAILAPESFGATGSGSVSFSLLNSQLTINANWTGLSGVTTVSHIHCCTAAPGAGTVAVAVTPGTLPGFPAGVQAGSYSTTIDLTQSGSFTAGFVNNFAGGVGSLAEAALVAGFDSNRAYFNIHTDDYPGGEIRGFITPVPEPASLALLATGLVGLAVPAYRRRRSLR